MQSDPERRTALEANPRAFRMPPVLQTRAGRPRRVGVELEFAGLDVAGAALAVQAVFGGHVVSGLAESDGRTVDGDGRFLRTVTGTDHGDWRVELDSRLLRHEAYRSYLEAVGVDLSDVDLRRRVEDLLEDLALEFVPTEITSPPLPMSELPRTEALRAELRGRKARGTRRAWRYAFGLQFNPELPDLSAATLLAYLRAYLLLEDWLRRAEVLDLTRMVLPYIDSFPEEYVQRVLDPAYRPEMGRFMDDYLDANPTRNRGLDLTPVFREIDEARLLSHEDLDAGIIKPRPTLHYRLPNSLVDDPHWRLAREWNRWVEVERLAWDPLRIRAMSGDYLARPGFPMDMADESWADTVIAWLAGSHRA